MGADDALAARFPIDAEEWRTWFNVHQYVFRHGVMLGNLSSMQRDLALGLVRATLSTGGFEQARNIMRPNGSLSELTSSPTEFGEWLYFVSIFGTPSADQPWGWQLDGHHLNINCLVLGDDMVLTPTFMGSEPCRVTSGSLAGVEVSGPSCRPASTSSALSTRRSGTRRSCTHRSCPEPCLRISSTGLTAARRPVPSGTTPCCPTKGSEATSSATHSGPC